MGDQDLAGAETTDLGGGRGGDAKDDVGAPRNLALDDFGAGVASFAYLQELPVTYVKLDGRIVSGLGTDPGSEVIIGSLVKLAKLRNIECIAEWVENQAAIDILRNLGVRYAQGFFLDMPSPLDG